VRQQTLMRAVETLKPDLKFRLFVRVGAARHRRRLYSLVRIIMKRLLCHSVPVVSSKSLRRTISEFSREEIQFFGKRTTAYHYVQYNIVPCFYLFFSPFSFDV